jgi:hypothetical protein
MSCRCPDCSVVKTRGSPAAPARAPSTATQPGGAAVPSPLCLNLAAPTWTTHQPPPAAHRRDLDDHGRGGRVRWPLRAAPLHAHTVVLPSHHTARRGPDGPPHRAAGGNVGSYVADQTARGHAPAQRSCTTGCGSDRSTETAMRPLRRARGEHRRRARRKPSGGSRVQPMSDLGGLGITPPGLVRTRTPLRTPLTTVSAASSAVRRPECTPAGPRADPAPSGGVERRRTRFLVPVHMTGSHSIPRCPDAKPS